MLNKLFKSFRSIKGEVEGLLKGRLSEGNLGVLASLYGPIVQWLRHILDVDETQVQFLVGPLQGVAGVVKNPQEVPINYNLDPQNNSVTFFLENLNPLL